MRAAAGVALFVGGLIVSVAKLVLDRDYAHWAPKLAARLVRLSARLVWSDEQSRWEREWTAELVAVQHDVPGTGGLAWASALPFAAVSLSASAAKERLFSPVNPAWVRQCVGVGVYVGALAFVVFGLSEFSVRVGLVALPTTVVWAVVRYAVSGGDGRATTGLPIAIGVFTTCIVTGLGPFRATGFAVVGALALCGFERVYRLVDRNMGELVGNQIVLAAAFASNAALNAPSVARALYTFLGVSSLMLGLVGVPMATTWLIARRLDLRQGARLGFAVGLPLHLSIVLLTGQGIGAHLWLAVPAGITGVFVGPFLISGPLRPAFER